MLANAGYAVRVWNRCPRRRVGCLEVSSKWGDPGGHRQVLKQVSVRVGRGVGPNARPPVALLPWYAISANARPPGRPGPMTNSSSGKAPKPRRMAGPTIVLSAMRAPPQLGPKKHRFAFCFALMRELCTVRVHCYCIWCFFRIL